MDAELYSLCNVLHSYKNAFLQSFDKIEETVVRAINTYLNAETQDLPTKESITTEIFSILSIWMKMLHTCESKSMEISSKFPHNTKSEKRCKRQRHSKALMTPPTTSSEVGLKAAAENVHAHPNIFSSDVLHNAGIDIKCEENVYVEAQPQNGNRTDVLPRKIIKPADSDMDRQHHNLFSDSRVIQSTSRKKEIEDIFVDSYEVSEADTSRETVINETSNFPETVFNISDNDNNKSEDDDVQYPSIFKRYVRTKPETSSEETKNSDKLVALENNHVNIAGPSNTHKAPQETNSNFKKGHFKSKVTNRAESQIFEESLAPEAPNTSPFRSKNFKVNHEIVERPVHSIREDSQQKNPGRANPGGSAVQKFLEMPRYDWREEVVNQHVVPGLKKTLKWAPLPKATDRSPSDKKPKERRPVLDVAEGQLSVGQTCVICHCDSPSEFYVRNDVDFFGDFEDTFNRHTNAAHPFVVNKFKSKSEARYNMGNFCLGYHSIRRKWYRLEVLDWLSDEDDDIIVQLIDYGEKMLWDYRQVKVMAELHTLFCKMAIKCHVAGIYSTCPNEPTKWSNESKIFFFNELEKMADVSMLFVYKQGDSYAVDFRSKNDPNSDRMTELLINNNHALEVTISGEDSSAIREEHADEDFSIINKFIINDDKDARDEESPVLEDTESAIEQENTTKLIVPEAGQVVQVLITGYVNTCHFYAQLLDSQSGDNLFNDDFQQLHTTMQTNNVVESYEMFNDRVPKTGDLVLVKDDSSWFRGRCVGSTNCEKFQIFLVDLGAQVVKTIEEIRMIKEEFLDVPFQAVECILYNCRELEKTKNTSSRNFYDNVYKMKVFQALVVESGEPLKLQLFDKRNVDMMCVLKQFDLVEVFPAEFDGSD